MKSSRTVTNICRNKKKNFKEGCFGNCRSLMSFKKSMGKSIKRKAEKLPHRKRKLRFNEDMK